MTQPLLARDVVRYVGEPVAVVVTEDRYQGEDAAELVSADYDPLPAVVDLAGAADDPPGLLFPEAGTNVTATFGDAAALRAAPVRRLRGGGQPDHHQPAGGARPDGDPGRGGRVGR